MWKVIRSREDLAYCSVASVKSDIDAGGTCFFLEDTPPLVMMGRFVRTLCLKQVCRRLKPDWAKACYRMAIARMALGLYEDAALAAWEVRQPVRTLHKIISLAESVGGEEWTVVSVSGTIATRGWWSTKPRCG